MKTISLTGLPRVTAGSVGAHRAGLPRWRHAAGRAWRAVAPAPLQVALLLLRGRP